ncbi:hypothetical protein KCP76_00305 [Salmonella enterica subsp. enterica serovar Weltevreden]|nr:hypothetical protein KCP76_00305 [Salmonella enterica subsp. enterica serovar Weltevreden]
MGLTRVILSASCRWKRLRSRQQVPDMEIEILHFRPRRAMHGYSGRCPPFQLHQ